MNFEDLVRLYDVQDNYSHDEHTDSEDMDYGQFEKRRPIYSVFKAQEDTTMAATDRSL